VFQFNWNIIPDDMEQVSKTYIYNTAVNVIMHHQGLECAFSELWKCERRKG